MGYPNDWYLFDLSMEQLPYHENYMDQYMWKPSSQMNFIIINFIEPKT